MERRRQKFRMKNVSCDNDTHTLSAYSNFAKQFPESFLSFPGILKFQVRLENPLTQV